LFLAAACKAPLSTNEKSAAKGIDTILEASFARPPALENVPKSS
jgi:hypothetical protein